MEILFISAQNVTFCWDVNYTMQALEDRFQDNFLGCANLLEQGLEAPIIIIIIIIIKSLCISLLLGNNVQSEEEISSENVNAQAHFPVTLPPEGGNYKVEDLRKIVTSCVTIGKSGNDIKYYLTARLCSKKN